MREGEGSHRVVDGVGRDDVALEDTIIYRRDGWLLSDGTNRAHDERERGENDLALLEEAEVP